MLVGLYSPGGAAHELESVRRAGQSGPDSRFVSHGPLSVATAGTRSSTQVGDVTCVLDGHLYEPAGLARELGIEVASDAVIVAHAFRRMGAAAFERLRGRFAVIIWEARRQRGVLASDVLAARPLFLWRGAGRVLFGTELAELLPLLRSRPGPDQVAFTRWLGGGSCPDGHTLYEGVSRIGPGELVELQPGGVQTETYWRPRYAGTLRGSPAELAEGLREALDHSIARRLSPELTGVVLSGGLDSSIVAGVASTVKRPDARVKTYSAVFPGSAFDESWKIRELTTDLGLTASMFEIAPQGTAWLALQHTTRWEMPLMGAGALIDSMVVAQAAADGAEVVLDGQTGDEVFGFAPYVVADRLRRGRLVAALKLAARWPMGYPTTRSQRLWILKNLGLKGAVPYGVGRYILSRRDPVPLGPSWLLPSRQREFSELEDPWAWKTTSPGTGGDTCLIYSCAPRTASCGSTLSATGRQRPGLSTNRRSTIGISLTTAWRFRLSLLLILISVGRSPERRSEDWCRRPSGCRRRRQSSRHFAWTP